MELYDNKSEGTIDDPPCPCHGYSERSARDKLTRHRSRGDIDWRMWWHDYCNQWHVERLETIRQMNNDPEVIPEGYIEEQLLTAERALADVLAALAKRLYIQGQSWPADVAGDYQQGMARYREARDNVR